MTKHADMAVIGGGVIGLSCAWRLAQAGLSVSVFERDDIGAGASSASLGALIPATATFHGPNQTLQRGSLWAYPDFAAELREASGIDIGYHRCGLLDIMHSESRRANALNEQEVAAEEWPHEGPGPVMEVIDNDAARAIEPSARFDAEGVRHCRAAAQVNVHELLRALAKACTAAGVTLRTGIEVREISIREDRVQGLQTPDERIEAGGVLVAAGAWTPALHPVLAELAPVAPVRGQALRLRSPSVRLQHIVKRRTAYLLPQPDGDILVGSTTEPEAGFDRRVTAAGVATLAEGARSLAPDLAQAAVVSTWSGLRPESLTHKPILGKTPGPSGLYVAAGHYKTGIAAAPLTGTLLAEVITGAPPSLDIAPFEPAPLAAASEDHPRRA